MRAHLVPRSQPQSSAGHVLDLWLILVWIFFCLQPPALVLTKSAEALSTMRQNNQAFSTASARIRQFGEHAFSSSCLFFALTTRFSCHRLKVAANGSRTCLSFKLSVRLLVVHGKKLFFFFPLRWPEILRLVFSKPRSLDHPSTGLLERKRIRQGWDCSILRPKGIHKVWMLLEEALEIDAKETNTVFKSSIIAIGKWEGTLGSQLGW